MKLCADALQWIQCWGTAKNDGEELGIQVSEADVSRAQRNYFVQDLFFRNRFHWLLQNFIHCSPSHASSCAEAGNSLSESSCTLDNWELVCPLIPSNVHISCETISSEDQKGCGTVCEC
jgi:hypothetical protein